MEPSAPLSRPSHDGTTHSGDAAAAAGATKLGLDTATSPRSATSSSPTTSPPYWVHSHQRSFSNISVESVMPGAITLEDNDNAADVKNKACWAKSVYIEDYVVVNENRTGIGAFIVWNITVETLRVSPESLWSTAEHALFTSLAGTHQPSHAGLLLQNTKALLRIRRSPQQTTPNLPQFPGGHAPTAPKERDIQVSTQVSRDPESGAAILSQVRVRHPHPACMTDSCSCILLNPEFSGSPVLKEFLFES